ncbi:MAG: hypothetical protein GXP09_03035 [Gammaproteobacteria bacterium]|nr:hypothetical protein [Gammaproteobacteria bacterium]
MASHKIMTFFFGVILALSVPWIVHADQPPAPQSPIVINSNMLGFGGPLSVSAQYSDRFGTSIRGEYTQTLGANNAFSLGLELGSDNQRLGATFAHAFDKHQRIKATIEHLRQGTEFQFSSGKVDETLTQNALGFSYQYTGLDGPLNDIHFNLYYADTDGKALADLRFSTETESRFVLFNNQRNIAGSETMGASVGGSVTPWQNGRVIFDLYYDDVDYDTWYIADQDRDGLGASLALEQNLSSNLRLNMLASSQQTYNQYRVGLARKIMRNNARPLTLELSGTHIEGRNSLADDDRISLGVRLGWGRGAKSTNNAALSLGNWTAKPAVYIPQVLAIVDEKTAALVEVNKTMIPSGSTIAASNGTVTVSGLEPLATSPILSVTRNGVAIGINPAQFSIAGNALLVHSLNLNPPATYVVKLKETDSDNTFVTIVTTVGSVSVNSITIDSNNSTVPPQVPPTVSLSNFDDGGCDFFSFDATYADTDGTVVDLKVFRNGTLIQTITVNAANGTENVRVSPSNGDVITVIATDNDGNESTVATHTIVTNCGT